MTASDKTSSGLTENMAGLLCYAFGWITGLIFIIIEKDNKFVRFHAMQSIITFLAFTVLSYTLPFIPVIGWIALLCIWPLSIVIWILCMVKAYQGERFKLPVIGDMAEKQT